MWCDIIHYTRREKEEGEEIRERGRRVKRRGRERKKGEGKEEEEGEGSETTKMLTIYMQCAKVTQPLSITS